jgi:hypothetical protein
MPPLQRSPAAAVHKPSSAVTLCYDRRRSTCFREEGKLSTRRSRDDAFIVLSLGEIVLSSKDAFLEEIETIWLILERLLVII